jgi:hypothetical protein
LVQLVLFWSSYSPLFLLFAIRFTSNGLRGVMAALCLGGVMSLVTVVRGRVRRLKSHPYELASVSGEGAAVSVYLIPYLLPFVAVPEPTTKDLVAYAIFLAVLAVIQVRTTVAQVNPLLYFCGLQVLAVQTTSGMRAHLICERVPSVGDRVHAVSLSETVLKATGWERRK